MIDSRKRLTVLHTDITTLEVDAIVNAANQALCGGGGVDGAIHRKAGPDLLAECRTLGGCKTGEAKITNAYQLPANQIIHTVGPVWYGGQKNEENLLASCYRSSLKLATLHGVKSLAFPSISTGAYKFPLDKACSIALREVEHFLSQNTSIESVTFAVFDENTWRAYQKAMQVD